jgi:aminopeptidase N
VTSADPYLPGHGDLGYDVESYDIELDYRVASNHLDGTATLLAVTPDPVDRLTLDLHRLDVRKVLVDGRRPAKYTARGSRLVVHLGFTTAVGQRLEIAVRYDGQPAPLRSTWGEVGWEELTDGVIVAGQPSGAPTWFPCNDRPSAKASYRISVSTESAYTVVANGTLVDRRVGASRTTWVYEQSRPMATYLATLQIGRYDVVELSRSPVAQHLVVPGRLRRPAGDDFARQPAMMRVFEAIFGPYPFGEYAVVVTDDDLEIPLEAQGLSVFGANHVDGRRSLERLVAHELAHQWFGNSLTLGIWSDIWLHEGFACYAEWLWSERSGGASSDALAGRHHARLAALAQDLVVADPGPDDMFDDRLYKRGALTLHALRRSLGDEEFFALLRTWVAENAYGTVDTAMFERHAGRYGEVTELLTRWLHRPELPSL